MPSITRLAACLLAVLIPAAATAQDRPGYGDAVEYFQADAQYEAWFQITRDLRRDFDWICGDTFCEGEYTNIQPLRFRCSVHRATGGIGMCTWTFAASHEEIAPATGRIGVQRAFWQCRAPLAQGTTIDQLLEALAVDEPLYAPLPGTQRSVMDGLIDCL
jgi:hypothetical protein